MSSTLQTTQAVAACSGLFISGAMLSIGVIHIPSILASNTTSHSLAKNWERMYFFAARMIPTSAVATTLIHIYNAAQRRNAGLPWQTNAVAGALTVFIVPFTLLAIAPTNNTLFGLLKKEEKEEGSVRENEVRALIEKWGWLHVVRTGVMLSGAVVAFRQLLTSA